MSNMLAKALQRLDACDDPDKRVYAIETANRVRKYTIQTPEDTWKDIAKSPVSHYYEVLSGPCNLYLDIEWVTPDECKLEDQTSRVQDIISHVCSQLHSLYGENDVAITKASASGISAKGYKSSWHVHMDCKKVCWLNPAAVGQFVRTTCSDFDEVDKAPYAGTGQNWRCVGSSKITEPQRRFVPVDRSTFLGCTVQQPVANRQVIYPDVPVSRAVACVPWVQRLAQHLEPDGVPQMCSESRCAVPFRKRQFCPHANRVHRSNHQYAVINLNTLMWKMACHACPDAISCWQVFPPEVLQWAFAQQCQQHCSTLAPPAVLVPGAQTADKVDIRRHGPPHRGQDTHMTVLCSDGVYSFNG